MVWYTQMMIWLTKMMIWYIKMMVGVPFSNCKREAAKWSAKLERIH